MGVSDAYYDEIETSSGLSFAANPRVPDLSRFLEEPDAMVFLEKEKAEVFRTVLEKVAWLSISMPSLMFCISWLSSYQAKPTENAMKALHAVLRYVKSQKGVYQAFPSPKVEFGIDDQKLIVGTVDASWSVRSTMGGYCHWCGCLLKAWARRIPVPCLSSAESELFSLVEGLRESLGVSMMMETVIYGVPPKDEKGFYTTDTGAFVIELRTDS